MNTCEGLNRPSTGKNDDDGVQNNEITFKLTRITLEGIDKIPSYSNVWKNAPLCVAHL
jgi:hypothetical protein